jgi:hypothetical protein
MKKAILAIAAIVMLWGVTASAQLPTQILGPGLNSGRTPYYQNFDRTLSADTLYILTGTYYIDSTYTITVPAGTVIQGDTAATMVVSRGAQAFMTGEFCNPIVMTSLKAPGSRAPGDWGGLVILGNAPTNQVNPVIEGGIIGGSYGGPDANDSSGIFRYLRVEYPGYRFQLNNEINGITLGGVGAGTEFHHVQVSYAFDDQFEFFGGTVDMKYMVAFGGTDDDFDTDFGYIARGQFMFGLRDPLFWDPAGESRGFESDGDNGPAPWTHPRWSNVTMVGPQREDATFIPGTATFDWSAVVREGSRLSLFNSVFMGYPKGLSFRDSDTKTSARDNILRWEDVSLQASVVGGTTDPSCTPASFAHVHSESRWPCTDAIVPGILNWFDNEPGCILSTTRLPSSIALVDMSNLNDPDPRPAAGSELLTAGVSWTDAYLNTADNFFDQTPTYRGAFDPDLPMYAQWTRCWTNFDPQNTDYSNGTVVTGADRPAQKQAVTLENYPNPFNPSTMIKFSVPVSGHVTLSVYNVRGELVKTLVDEAMDSGVYEEAFNANGLASGTYFYRVTGEGFTKTAKMVLLK